MACKSCYTAHIEITLAKAKDPPASIYGNIDVGNTSSDHVFQKTCNMPIDVGPGETLALALAKVGADNTAFNVYENLLNARDFSIVSHGTASFTPKEGTQSTTVRGGTGELIVSVTFTKNY